MLHLQFNSFLRLCSKNTAKVLEDTKKAEDVGEASLPWEERRLS